MSIEKIGQQTQMTNQEKMALTEEQLLQIIDKCKNYEINVQKFKVDLKYIQELRNCIEDYHKLMSIVPANRSGNSDAKLINKVSKQIEKKVLELFELIRNHKYQVIPMEILGQLTALQDFGEFTVNETLKAKFLTLIVREYRKFKEVANIRQHKKQAVQMLDKIK